MKSQIQGVKGERLAREFLEQQGYEFIQANFMRRVGEIDLIMRAPSTCCGFESNGAGPIVFIEVRYRCSSDFGGAIESIDWRKQRKMIRVAQAWLQRHASSLDCARIDVIALQPKGNTPVTPELRHWQGHDLRWIENAVEALT